MNGSLSTDDPSVAASPATLVGGTILSEQTTFTSVLRHRSFFWFTAGQSISFFGDKLHSMALIGLIGAITPGSSAIVLAGLAVLYCVPFLLITPIAGVLVDRWSRKWTLVGCDAMRAVLVALIPATYAATASLAPLFCLVGAVFALTLLFNVAKMAILPDLVPAHDLLSANAISSLLTRIATLAGIVLGGVIVGWTYRQRLGWPGYTAAFYIDSLTFCISVVTLLALSNAPPRAATSRPPAEGVRPSSWRRATLGIRQIVDLARKDRSVLFVLLTTALLGLVGGCMYIVVVVVVQTRTTWGTAGVGYLFGVTAIGLVVGSAVLGQFGQRWSKRRVVTAAFLTMAALLAASAHPFSFAWHGPLSFVGGLVLGPMMIAQDTMLHERLPEEIRGRVFSAREVLLNVGFGLAAAATGLTVTVLSRLGVDDPFRSTLLAVAPMVLLATVAAELIGCRGRQ